LVRALGEGAYSTVFLAEVEQPETDMPQEVAIKILSGRLTKRIRLETLKRELSSLLAVQHPNIPQVYDWSLDGQRPFVVMEYYRQGTLAKMLQDGGQLAEEEILPLLDALLDALCAAHRACLLHLDIKPGNVLVRDDGGYALTDFGTAQAALAGGEVVLHAGRGTRGYQAPEQGRGASADFDIRTDLYGIGATVWSACTGVDLTSGRGQRLLQASRDDAFSLPPVARLRPMIPPETDQLIRPLLAHDPASRPGNPADVLARVRRASSERGEAYELRGRPVTQEESEQVRRGLIDPLWSYVIEQHEDDSMRYYDGGQLLAEQGEASYHVFILLKGRVRVEQDGRGIAVERREGTFLGEVAALTGGVRMARMVAEGEVWVMVLDLMQMQRLVTDNPAVGLRLVQALADRLAQQGGHPRPPPPSKCGIVEP